MARRTQREPSAESLAEIPELDVENVKILRRGPKPGHVFRLSLSEIRRAVGKTQVEVAVALGSGQDEVSKLERRDDTRLSTLRRYAEAVGARLEVVFVLDKTGHRIELAERK